MNLNIQLMIINVDFLAWRVAWWSTNRFSSLSNQVINYSVKAVHRLLFTTYIFTDLFWCGFDAPDQFNIVQQTGLLKFHPQMRGVSTAVMQKINLLVLSWR